MDSNVNRQALLPPYLEDSPAWSQLLSLIDQVFKDEIDDPTVWLRQLRDSWIEAGTAKSKIEGDLLLTNTDWEVPEKEILVKQAYQLGFHLDQPDILSAEDYQRIVRNIAQYWYSKGTPSFADFLSFVLNTSLQITNLWSGPGTTWDDYSDVMLPKGDPGIGTPVWEGGEWFQTTHISIVFDPQHTVAINTNKIRALFYALANFNLVLDSITFDTNIYIHSVDSETDANILMTGLITEIELTIATTDVIESTYVDLDYVEPDYV